ncbi:MAG TPA: transporter substrate-binding domain-containing protein [Rhodospirillales bacterium]|nr:transporter substrate-binding domain-containing protein [Rhodospirillales bacterium]
MKLSIPRTLFTLLASILIALAQAASASADSFVLNTDDVPPLATKDMKGYHNRLAIEAFKRLGHVLTIPQLPSGRSLLNAQAGIDDGTLPRIAGLTAEYPNLLQVPEKLMDYQFTAFTMSDNMTVRTWEDLRQYTVGYVYGWKIFERSTKDFPNVISVRDPDLLFSLLAKNRADVVLLERWQGLLTAKKLGLKGVRAILPPLAEREMFIYMHKKHAALLPKLAQALRSMKKDGAYERIYAEVLAPLAGM